MKPELTERRHPAGRQGGFQTRVSLHRRAAAAVLVLALLAGCQTQMQLLEVQDADYLYFGTARTGGAAVSEAEWKAFVDDTITPRWQGFTEWTAEGHWQTQREVTHVVQMVHPHGSGVEKDIAEIIAAYKQRFDQQSVFWVRTPAVAQAR